MIKVRKNDCYLIEGLPRFTCCLYQLLDTISSSMKVPQCQGVIIAHYLSHFCLKFNPSNVTWCMDIQAKFDVTAALWGMILIMTHQMAWTILLSAFSLLVEWRDSSMPPLCLSIILVVMFFFLGCTHHNYGGLSSPLSKLNKDLFCIPSSCLPVGAKLISPL